MKVDVVDGCDEDVGYGLGGTVSGYNTDAFSRAPTKRRARVARKR